MLKQREQERERERERDPETELPDLHDYSAIDLEDFVVLFMRVQLAT